VVSHSQPLSGLVPNTLYHYQVRSVDAGGTPVTSPDATFTTTNAPPLNSLLLGGAGYAEANHATKLNVTGDWTVEAWFKDETPGGYNHDTTYIAMKGNTDANGEAPFLLGVGWNTLFAGERTAWTNHTVSTSVTTLSPSTWHHAAATFVASTRTLTLYLDGAQAAQGILGARTTAGNTLPVEIGRNGNGSSAWRGKLDDLRIWNVVRTATEISTSFRSELGSAPATLVGNWKFNEGGGTTAADSTASPQNAALLGTAGWSADVGNVPPVPDTTPPVISSVTATGVTGASATISWTTDEAADTQVEYGTTTGYGTLSPLNSLLVLSHSQTIGGLTANTLYHYRARSADGSSNLAVSTDFTFTTAAPPPPTTISSVNAGGITNTAATITWTTNNPASSQVNYGTSASYGSATTLDTTLVTSHSQSLSGLVPNTTYHYQIRSTDAGGTPVTAGDFTFTTTNAPAINSLWLTGGAAEAPHATKLNLTGDWTIEAWFKDENAAGYDHDTSYALTKGDSNVNGEAPYFIGVQWNTLFAGARTGWSNSYISASLASVSTSTWHHAAATFVASSRQLTLYLDGTQVGQGILAARSAGNTLPVDIGRNGSTGQSWNGKLDDVRIWNVVRTPSEISTSYRTELTTAPASLVGNWKFNEGSGMTAADSTPAPQNAALLAPADWSTDVHP
jgi:hypothetical protein